MYVLKFSSVSKTLKARKLVVCFLSMFFKWFAKLNNIGPIQMQKLHSRCWCHFVLTDSTPAVVPPQSSSGSVLYLSGPLFVLKLALQGFYPGTVVGIELTQRLAWAREQKHK